MQGAGVELICATAANDREGEEFIQAVLASVLPVAKSVRRVRVPISSRRLRARLPATFFNL
jgi:hypothetical protein